LSQNEETLNKWRAQKMSEIEYSFQAWKKLSVSELNKLESVIVGRNGLLTISQDLFDKYFSLEYKSAEIFIDTTLKAIALKPSKTTAGIPFSKTGNSNTFRNLNIKALFVLNNVEPKQYKAKWSEKYGMLIFTYSIFEKENPK
jgi:hypothetical protein